MNKAATDVLVVGYGNPGRLDDGLGPALAETLENLNIEGVTVDSNYQLNVEDAEALAAHKVAIFADATVQGHEPFEFKATVPRPALGFSSHSMEPDTVYALAQEMFQAETKCYTLGICGYEFNEFGEFLSPAAEKNLALALEFLIGVIKKGNFDEVVHPD